VAIDSHSDTLLDGISSVEEARHLRADWTDLLDAGGQPSPFLTWEWLFTWWLHYGNGRPGKQLAIVTARDGSTLSALLPGYVRTAGFAGATLRSFHLLGTTRESSDGLDVPQREPTRDDLVPHLIAQARGGLTLDRICLGNVDEESALVARVRALSAQERLPLAVYRTHTCPYLPITGSWDEYLASRGRAFRQVLRRRTRRFMERPGASFDWVQDASELPPSVQDVFTLHERRFARKGARTGFVARRRGDFHRDVSRLMFERGALRLFRLRVEGRTIATLYCFAHASRLFYYQGGVDPNWERDSVGTVLMGQVVKHAFDQGLVTFEFLRGTEAYKFRWTDRVRHLVRADLGVSRRGGALVRLTSAYRSIQNVAPKDRSTGLKN
jgi:CelD/BcsL family acetyltransferase involved in cellulose biosynthesis